MRTRRAGLWIAAATLVAGLLSSGRSEPIRPTEDEGPAFAAAGVSHVVESKLFLDGRRTTVVVFVDGKSTSSARSIEDWAAEFGWPCFTLSDVSRPKRRVLIRPGAVTAVSRSNWRRTRQMRPDTLVTTVAGPVVVREELFSVKRAVGLS